MEKLIGVKNYQLWQQYRLTTIFFLIFLLGSSGVIWVWQEGLIHFGRLSNRIVEISALEEIRQDNQDLYDKLLAFELHLDQLEQQLGSGAVNGTKQTQATNQIIKTTSNQSDDRTISRLINLNTATQVQLEKLPGIGPSKAKAIIEYRVNNSFEQKSDLKKVKGIGDKIYQGLESMIVVE